MAFLASHESYHLGQDSRFLEIEKSIRLSELAPGQLALLRTRGACSVELPETSMGIALSRIDNESPQRQLTLKVASVVGRTFVADP